MNAHNYYLIAMVGAILIFVVAVVWYAMLKRFSVLLSQRLGAKGLEVSSVTGLIQFLFRGEFRDTRDEQLIAVCRRFRSMLFACLGWFGAYVVFLIMMRPRF